jgi:hypothetical protein
MGFESWPVLLLLATLAIPFLLERLRQRRSQPTPFPAIRFLVREQSRFSRVLVFRRYMAVVLRAAVIVLLVAAFAHPFLKRGVKVGRAIGADTAAVVVLDNSPLARVSVEGRSLLQVERDLVAGFVRAKASDATVALLPLVGAVPGARPLFESDVQALRAALDTVEVDPGAVQPRAALDAAAGALKGVERTHRVIYWVSPRLPGSWKPPDGVQMVAVHPAPGRLSGGAVIRSATTAAGRVEASLANLSGAAWRGALELSGRSRKRLFREDLQLPPWGEKTVEIPLRASDEYLGELHLTPTGPLARYQSRYVHVRSGTETGDHAYLVSSGDPTDRLQDPLFFLRVALKTQPDLVLFSQTPQGFESESPGPGDWAFYVLDGPDYPAAEARFRQLLDRGVRLWVIPGSEPPPNSRFFDLTLVGLKRGVHPGFRAPAAGESPLAGCLAGAVTREVLLASGYRTAGYAVLGESGDGLPLLLGRPEGSGYLVVGLTRVTPPQTDLPLQPCFASLVESVRARGQRDVGSARRLVLEEGDLLQPPVPSGPGEAPSLLLPDGRSLPLEGEPVRLPEPGRYRVGGAARQPAEASDLAVNPRVDFDRAALEWPPEGEPEAAATAWGRTDLSRAALLLALLVLFSEVLFSIRVFRGLEKRVRPE